MEIVVDGTDGAGKTPLVGMLVARIEAAGREVAHHAPYRVREVFPLWERAPREAAEIITTIMRTHREANPDRVLVWDRGWPTAWVSTDDRVAREAFLPLPEVTVLLLSTPHVVREKAAKHASNAPWMVEETLIDRFHRAYHRLAHENASVLAYEPDAQARYDLDAIAAAVLARAGIAG